MVVDLVAYAGIALGVGRGHVRNVHRPLVGEHESVPGDSHALLEGTHRALEFADELGTCRDEEIAAGRAVIERPLDLADDLAGIIAVDAELEYGVDHGTFGDGP